MQKEFGDTTILVFDGWRIKKPEETLKQYAIIMLSEDSVNIDTIYTEGNFFATDIVFYNDQYYLIGNKSHSMESGRSNIIMYNIHNNDYTLILSVIGLINIRDITLFENYVVASYRLSPEKEYFFVYDLKLDEPSANFNLSEYKKGTNANRFQHIIFLNENILLFYQHSRNKIGVVKLNEQFEVVESLIVDTVEHEGIKNIIKHQNDIYVLTNMREKGALSKFNNDINELRVLIDFEIINNKEMIFLSTVIFDEESIK